METAIDRVRRLLAEHGAGGEPVELATTTHTSAQAAAALGVDVAQIAKTLVFAAGDGAVVVVAAGADRVDTERLATVVGMPVRRADPQTVLAATGYEVGAVSPVGLPDGLIVLVDEGLRAHAGVWAAAGTTSSVFPTSYDELLRLTRGTPADVRAR